MGKLFIIVILVLVCGGFLFLRKPTGRVVDVSGIVESEEFFELKEMYNKNADKIPSVVKKIFGNEDISVYISLKDGSEKPVSLVMRNGMVDTLGRGSLDKPTMKVYVSEDTINKIKDGKLNIVDALNNKDIRYESLTVKTGIKMKAASLGSKIFGWLK